MRRERLIALIVLVTITIMTLSAAGQKESKEELKFPTKPLKVVIPWAAGGSSDIMLRAMAEQSPKYFGQPMIIINRPGAGGTIGAAEFVKAEADGYNIIMLAIGLFTTQPFMRDVQYKLEDFEGIIGLSYEPIILLAHKDSPYNNIEELIDHAKKIGRPLKYGASGSGSLPHLSQAAFFNMAGIKADLVSFDGGAPTVTALLGKHVDVAAAHPAEMLPLVQDGQLKMLGIFSSERDSRPILRDVPTFKEKGFDINMAVWKFLLTPKGTPKVLIDKLYEGFLKIIKDEKFTKFAENAGLVMIPYRGDEVIKRIKAEAESTYVILKQLGLAKK